MRARHFVVAVVCALTAALVPGVPALAAAPAGFQDLLVVGSGLAEPTGFQIAPDGRIFVLERAGTVRVVKDGVLLAQPFATLPSAASGDRGLLGVAFDPAFGVANYDVYFYYTGVDLRNHLVRFDASGDVGAEGPYELFTTQSPSQLLHVGGTVAFGPDGKLYLAVGDNGQPPNAQDLSNPYGKILRINKDGSIPPDNPFVGQPGAFGAIWAYGMRNPWRFQFDPATGEMFGGDVGDFSWEELNHIVPGANYGWPLAEGLCTTGCEGLTDPIHAYPHDNGSSSVVGGPVYRGSMFPAEYQGALFFADYAQGFIKVAHLDDAATVTNVSTFDPVAGAVVDLKVAPDGSLYYVDIYPGTLHRVVYDTTSHAPVAAASASVTEGPEPLQVRFSSAGSNDPDGDALSFDWDFGDGTTSTAANPTKTYTSRGTYTVRLTVSDGAHQVAATPIAITAGTRPTLSITAPRDGARYRAGDTIHYGASAVDAAGRPLGAEAFTTRVLLHHGTHVHPFLGPVASQSGEFTIPVSGEASADTWHEIIITGTDEDGLTATSSVNIYPLTTQISLASDVPGGVVLLDGVPTTTPATIAAVVGFQREIAAPPTAVGNDGTVYHFTGWSDDGAIRHTITMPETGRTYTAHYAPSAPFTGQYFANRDLAGAPVLTRADKSIDFVWNLGAPSAAVPADNFSVRWTTTEYFAAGRYKFTTVSDDGVRLYLDGALVLDEWRDMSTTSHEVVAELGSGEHTVVLEYYDSGWDATVRLSWDTTTQPSQGPSTTWLAEYWNTPGAGAQPTIPSGPPDVSRQESAIDHEWWQASPAPGIASDHFVARWTRTVAVEAGTYAFAVTADDGVRLSIDGNLVLDHWMDQSASTRTITLPLAAGSHTVVLEYYENAWDATVTLTWQATNLQPTATWLAEYWNMPGSGSAPAMPSGPPDVSRQESAIDHEWWQASPAPGISGDHFVARWTRVLGVAAGAYRFTVTTDDGVRLYVDGVLVIDHWGDQGATTYDATVHLEGGPHTVVLEYYENAWDATAKLSVDHAV